MKNITLPAISLALIVSFNSSYGSPSFEDPAITPSSRATPLQLDIEAGSYNKGSDNINSELEHLQAGINFVSSGDFKSANESFENAIEYGSPLGYLYAGALEEQPQTRLRYLSIASSAADNEILSKDIYKLHRNYLTKKGFISVLEWRIKKQSNIGA